MVYFCSVFLFWISTLVTQSEQGVLPLPKNHHRDHRIIRILNEAPLKTLNNQHDLAKHENTMLRKSVGDLSRHRVVLPYSKYDENGRIYLSRPTNNDDRKINALMNKIVKYKTEDEQMDGLRTRLHDLFTSEEIEQMENIIADVDGLDNRRQNSNENGRIKPKMVYEFSDLVF